MPKPEIEIKLEDSFRLKMEAVQDTYERYDLNLDAFKLDFKVRKISQTDKREEAPIDPVV